MSTFPEVHVFDPTVAPAGSWAVQAIPVIDMRQWSEKGYSYYQGVGKAWTGSLQGSVLGDVWTDIDACAASAEGAIPVHFNYARFNVTGAGVIGTGTRIGIAGKVL